MDRHYTVLLLVVCINGAMGLYRHTYSACYGITTDNFIKASCPGDDERIVMDSVYAYAKPLSLGCPETMTNPAATPTECCQYDPGDCGSEYDGFNKNTYYENCHGLTTCYWTPVAWTNAPCNSSVFPLRTNYMMVSFYCVSENGVKDISEDGSVNTTAAILLNPGYVSGNNTGALPANSSYTCSVSASCATTLKIRTLTLNFTKEGGLCGQSLSITDGSNTHVLSCDSNTNFLPSDLNISNDTYYLQIQVNNTLSTDAGYFLLQIGDANDDDHVTLACGTSVGEGRVSPEDLPECSNDTFDSTTSAGTTTSVTDATTSTSTTGSGQPNVNATGVTDTGSSQQSHDKASQDESNFLGIIIGAICGVLVLTIVGVMVIFRDRIKDLYITKCKNGVHPETENKEKEINEISDENFLFGPPVGNMIPQVAPMSVLMHTAPSPMYEKHKQLPPINKTSVVKEKGLETHKEKKTEKEKRKKKKHKKNKLRKSDDTTTVNLRASIKSDTVTVDVASL